MERRLIESFLRGETAQPWSAVLRLPLIPLSIVFGELAAARVRYYARSTPGRCQALPVPVISVGNLTAGGTGKTPFVRTLARWLLALGERPLILGRGAGSSAPGGALDEEGASLRRDLPGALVAQGRDRLAAAAPHLDSEQRAGLVILEDGAQHRRIPRDIELMLVDATCPFGSGWPFPAGCLREFPGALARADAVLLTRSDEVTEQRREGLEAALVSLSGGRPLVRAIHREDRLLPEGRPADLAGRSVLLVSGVARPESFLKLVRKLGARVAGVREFRDHFAYTERQARAAEAQARSVGAELILATGKDEPKLSPLVSEACMPWRFLEVRCAVERSGAEALARVISRVVPAVGGGDPGRALG